MSNPSDHLQNDLRKLGRQLETFWTQTYPALSREERIAYWTKNLGEGINWERKSGGDPYSVFTPEALAGWRTVEPDFEGLLPAIVQALKLDPTKVESRIREPD